MKKQEEIKKRDAIFIGLKIFLFTVIFTLIFLKIMYGKIQIIPFLISMAVLVPVIAISSIIGYNQRKKLEKNNGKDAIKVAIKNYSKFTKIIGILLIAFSIPLIITNPKVLISYVNIVVGVIFIIWGIHYSNKYNNKKQLKK